MAVTGLGLLGTGSSKTAATTLAVTNTTGAAIPAGTLVHIVGCWDNINSVTAPTITCSTVGGGSATADHATAVGSGVTTTAGSGIWHQCFRVLTTSSIASGATIATLTSNQSAVARAAHADGWTAATTTVGVAAITSTSTSGAPSVTSTSPSAGSLVIGSVSYENSAQMTGDTDTANGTWSAIVGTFTTGGSANTNAGTGSQYKIPTAGGGQTYNPTAGVADTVACICNFTALLTAVTQQAYRFYADGTETGASALAAQNTAYTAALSTTDLNLLIRVMVQSTNVVDLASTIDWRLQWEKNASGTWTNTTTSSSTVAGFDSANLTEGAATTNQLTGGTGTFTPGMVSEDGLADNLGFPGNNYTELLYTVTLKKADLADGDTLRFRLLGGTTFTYTQTPTINVTVGAGVPSGTSTGGYDFTKTTATGAKAPLGSSVAGTYAWNRTAAVGAKTQTGTAVGAYAYAGTATGLTPAIGPKTGTAAGTYAWARTAATGAVVKAGTTSGTYAFNRTTATGQRTPKGQTTGGTYTWTGNAQGLAPVVGVKAGTAIGAYVWARTLATGYVLRKGTAAGAYSYAGTAAGAKTQRGTTTGAYAFNRTTATGTKTPKGTASGTYSYAGTATGTKAPRGAATGSYTYAGTAAGAKVQRGTSAGTYAFNRTAATGVKTTRGTSSGAYLWARTTATGVRTPKATGSGTYNWSGSGTGKRAPKATATGTYLYAGVATGVRPIPGVKQGTALGFYVFARTTAHASTTRRGTATGTYLYAGTATGSKVQRGTSTGTYLYVGTGTGKRQPKATSVGGFDWTRTTATGTKPSRATAAGAYLYVGTAVGATPGVVHYVEDFAGNPAQAWGSRVRLPIQTF